MPHLVNGSFTRDVSYNHVTIQPRRMHFVKSVVPSPTADILTFRWTQRRK